MALAVAVGLAPLSGCGASDQSLVQSKVEQLAKATASKSYKTLCHDVFAPQLIAHLALSGLSCERAMQIALSDVHDPVLSIGHIAVNGRNASAITLTGARGQQGSIDEIGLIKTDRGWRVASLGSPAGTDQVVAPAASWPPSTKISPPSATATVRYTGAGSRHRVCDA